MLIQVYVEGPPEWTLDQIAGLVFAVRTCLEHQAPASTLTAGYITCLKVASPTSTLRPHINALV